MTYAAPLDEAARAGDWVAVRALYEDALARSGLPEAREGVARTCWWLGEVRTAVDQAERAFAEYEQAERDAEAAMLGLHLCIWYLGNLDNASAARGWLARARRLAEASGDPLVGGWADLVAGYLADEADEGRRSLERAAATAGRLGDADLANMALADLGLWHVTSGDPQRGLEMLDEAMAATLAEPRGMLEVVVWSSCDMLAACSLLDDIQRATDWCREADRFTETYGCPFLQARCRAHYGRVLMATGDWDRAESELRRAVAMSVDSGRGPRTEAVGALAELRLRQGDAEAALELLYDEPPSLATTVTRAACLVALGRAQDARALLRGQLAVHATPDPAIVAALVDADLALGLVDEACALVARDAPVWMVRPFPRAGGLLARAAGLVATASGAVAVARAELAGAFDEFSRLGLPFEAARTELDLARLLARSDRDAAAAHATSALQTLRTLGARHGAGEAAELLRSLGVTPPPGRPTKELLTSRERDVVLLLAQGLTNPEIAVRLCVSPRTVGHHVSSILRKTGLRSRSEAAAHAAELAGAR